MSYKVCMCVVQKPFFLFWFPYNNLFSIFLSLCSRPFPSSWFLGSLLLYLSFHTHNLLIKGVAYLVVVFLSFVYCFYHSVIFLHKHVLLTFMFFFCDFFVLHGCRARIMELCIFSTSQVFLKNTIASYL